MNLSDDSLEPASVQEKLPEPTNPPASSNSSMEEYYQLKQTLLLVTLVMTGVIFIPVWIVYSLNIALNYLIGACTGVVYLRMLAKNVEQLSEENQRMNPNRFALFSGLIIIASQWQNLHIVPIFLGFLTFKAAIIAYMLPSSIFPTSK